MKQFDHCQHLVSFRFFLFTRSASSCSISFVTILPFFFHYVKISISSHSFRLSPNVFGMHLSNLLWLVDGSCHVPSPTQVSYLLGSKFSKLYLPNSKFFPGWCCVYSTFGFFGFFKFRVQFWFILFGSLKFSKFFS